MPACVTEGRAAAQRASLLSRCSALTPDLAAAAAPYGTLLVAAADWGMFELFGINWLTHVQRSGLDNYLLIALDAVSGLVGHAAGWAGVGAGCGGQHDPVCTHQQSQHVLGTQHNS